MGKVILTNTTIASDQLLLCERGLHSLVTTTPVLDGRSFGMNVLEGCMVALMNQRRDTLTPENYEVYINKLELKPNVMQLNADTSA